MLGLLFDGYIDNSQNIYLLTGSGAKNRELGGPNV